MEINKNNVIPFVFEKIKEARRNNESEISLEEPLWNTLDKKFNKRFKERFDSTLLGIKIKKL